MEEFDFQITDAGGNKDAVKVSLKDYELAARNNMSLSQYLSRRFHTSAEQPSPFEQMLAQSNIFLQEDHRLGIRPPTMDQVLNGDMQLNTGAIRGPDGTDKTVAGRLLFPELILQTIETVLRRDDTDFLGAFNRMVATTQSVTSSLVQQPMIDVTAPEASRNQPISQGAEPARMVHISTADRPHNIPTRAIGLEVTDQALQAATIDMVGLTLAAQARGERIGLVENHLAGMISGDPDLNESAIADTSTAASFDSSITAPGEISHRAWIKWLRNRYKFMSMDWIICDLDTALAIQDRTGRPTVQSDDPNSPRIDQVFQVDNLGVVEPRLLIMDTEFIGANTMVGLDSRWAIRRLVNVNASYRAVQDFVLRRTTGFRFDYGESAHKFYPDAWSVNTLTV